MATTTPTTTTPTIESVAAFLQTVTEQAGWAERTLGSFGDVESSICAIFHVMGRHAEEAGLHVGTLARSMDLGAESVR
jgi:hypothetical protein